MLLNNNKNIILLCGGLSKRIFEHINVPKPLYKINNISVLENNLQILKNNLIENKNIYININNQHRKYYEEFLEENSYNFIFENTAIGTAGSVKKIVDENCLKSTYVIYGDQFYNSNFLKEVLDKKVDENSIFTIDKGDISKSGVAIYDSDFNLIDFKEKPQNFDKTKFKNYSINLGLYYFDNFQFFKNINQKKEIDFGKDIFPYCVKNNLKIKIVPLKSNNLPIFIDDLSRINKIKK